MRTVGTVVLAVVLTLSAGCAGGHPVATGGQAPSGRLTEEDRLGIYEAVIRDQIDFKGSPVRIDERICTAIGDRRVCPEAFTAQEQRRLIDRLSDIPDVAFVSWTRALSERIFAHGDAILVSVGPIALHEGRVEVRGEYYCGNVCAGGSVWLVRRTGDGWRVVGPAPGYGVGMA